MANRTLLQKKHQQGATMVEMAITLPLFLVIVFAIFEFALAIFAWSRAVEATRAGARYAIVNDAVMGLPDCNSHAPGAEVPPESDTCDNANCSNLMLQMQRLYPDLLSEHVAVAYECSFAGFSDNPKPVMQVTVAISGQPYHLMLPGLLGLDSTWTLPAFATTRISEDMHTYAGP